MVRDYAEELSEKEVNRLAYVNDMIKGQYYEGDNGKRYSLKIHAPRDTLPMVLSVGDKHDDTDNLHYHIMLKTANELTRRELSFDRADLFMQRGKFASELEHHGIERTATLRRDRQQVLAKVEQGVEHLHECKIRPKFH